MRKVSVWQMQASEVLRDLMKKRGVTANELARRVTTLGIEISGQAVRNKLPRGTFSAAFFFAAIAAMKNSRVTLSSRKLCHPTERARIATKIQAKKDDAALLRSEAAKRRWQREQFAKRASGSDLSGADKRKLERSRRVEKLLKGM